MFRRTFLALIAATAALPAFAAPAVFNTDDIAINGYDPVAYFTEGMPIEGQLDYAVHWNDAVWLFSTHENMALFEADPEAYAPSSAATAPMRCPRGSLPRPCPRLGQSWTANYIRTSICKPANCGLLTSRAIFHLPKGTGLTS